MFVFIIWLNFRKHICIIHYSTVYDCLILPFDWRGVRRLKGFSCALTGIYEDCSAAWWPSSAGPVLTKLCRHTPLQAWRWCKMLPFVQICLGFAKVVVEDETLSLLCMLLCSLKCKFWLKYLNYVVNFYLGICLFHSESIPPLWVFNGYHDWDWKSSWTITSVPGSCKVLASAERIWQGTHTNI